MAKYGTFMKTEDFGSQFFMGAIVKSIGLKAYQIKFSSSEKINPIESHIQNTRFIFYRAYGGPHFLY